MGQRMGLLEDFTPPTSDGPVMKTLEQEYSLYCLLDFISVKQLKGITMLEFWEVSNISQVL